MKKNLISFCILLLVVQCTPRKQSYSSVTTMGFDKEGHRGCRGLMPENTIPAMLTAIGLGVTTLELDVLITKDRQVIVSHDPFINHEIAAKPDGSYFTKEEEKEYVLYNMTYEEIKKFDVGLKPYAKFPLQKKIRAAKPLLSELIDSVENYARQKNVFIQYNIETKTAPAGDDSLHPKPAPFVELLMSVLQSKNIIQRVIIQSFDFRTLQYLHQHYPSIKTAALIDAGDTMSLQQQLQKLQFLPAIYSPHFSLVTKALIQECHRKGIKVIPWTVNKLEQMQQLKAMGVDGLISDYPNLYAQL